ncbi:hypothetical protein BpHYR1_025860 [Brachionus plicatilis]|uniref:Uncharacterized protein n=1 Tax=Brachionus plicatilis TaxID=10195 RepID=A0A3M7RD99_BRAPC|nr:hypothetical protein BpHYR1_025860 [Brachionus plicatilis]
MIYRHHLKKFHFNLRIKENQFFFPYIIAKSKRIKITLKKKQLQYQDSRFYVRYKFSKIILKFELKSSFESNSKFKDLLGILCQISWILYLESIQNFFLVSDTFPPTCKCEVVDIDLKLKKELLKKYKLQYETIINQPPRVYFFKIKPYFLDRYWSLMTRNMTLIAIS